VVFVTMFLRHLTFILYRSLCGRFCWNVNLCVCDAETFTLNDAEDYARIRIRIFIYPPITIQQHFYDSIGNVITVYLLIRTFARFKYIRITHRVGRLFAHRGLDDLGACCL
jgi:hypothetical protein